MNLMFALLYDDVVFLLAFYYWMNIFNVSVVWYRFDAAQLLFKYLFFASRGDEVHNYNWKIIVT